MCVILHSFQQGHNAWHFRVHSETNLAIDESWIAMPSDALWRTMSMKLIQSVWIMTIASSRAKCIRWKTGILGAACLILHNENGQPYGDKHWNGPSRDYIVSLDILAILYIVQIIHAYDKPNVAKNVAHSLWDRSAVAWYFPTKCQERGIRWLKCQTYAKCPKGKIQIKVAFSTL